MAGIASVVIIIMQWYTGIRKDNNASNFALCKLNVASNHSIYYIVPFKKTLHWKDPIKYNTECCRQYINLGTGPDVRNLRSHHHLLVKFIHMDHWVTVHDRYKHTSLFSFNAHRKMFRKVYEDLWNLLLWASAIIISIQKWGAIILIPTGRL